MRFFLFLGLLFICFGLVDAIEGHHILTGFAEFTLGSFILSRTIKL